MRKKNERLSRKEKWELFKRTLPDAIEIARPQAKLWVVGLALLLCARIAGLVLPAAPKYLIDSILPSGNLDGLNIIVGAVILAAIIQGTCNFALTQTISKAGQRMIAELRKKMHNHVSRLSVSYFDNHKIGEITSRVINDVEGVRNLVGTGMVELIGGIITAGLALGILFFLSWQMTIAILIFLGVFLIILMKTFGILRPIFKERQEEMAKLNGRLHESISGIRIVKSYNKEETERTIFADGVNRLLNALFKTINAVSFVALSSSVLLGILGASILYLGGSQLMNGDLTTGEFISYLLYLGFMIAPLSSIMMIGTQMSEVFAGIERMKEVLDIQTEEGADEGKSTEAVTGRIEFHDVSFSYDEGEEVLKNINLVARAGTVTALVGASGSGKSTLISLLARFYPVKEGKITLDGTDLKEFSLASYRDILGVVLQDDFLFDGTVKENLMYVSPDCSEEDLENAMKLSHSKEFIDDLPERIDTVIGERGVKLSGGQRQRLTIARAILADPKILILDEATSALDSESEAYIQEGLSQLMEGRTTFVIAHRLSTIRKAYQILVLDGGEIIESGNHEELLVKRGKYHSMYTRQHHLDEEYLLAPGEEIQSNGEEVEESSKDRSERMKKISKIISGE